ncbi:sulfotransferase [Salegentibacter sediminis]|uniref:sulfotransferase n=1 Tax=Salegentibacter sediminis TaxID=1930251 RepID=UPI0009BF05C7|nr:sulfotransferase [Salegentibacter sediminis]
MLRSRIKTINNYFRVYNKPKVFGIGANKTGTTSLKTAMADLGFIIGSQKKAENFLYDWGKRDFHRIIKYCYSAQFFQDIPFSLPYTYIILDHKFPGSKFILTIRNDSEEWYESLIKYHSIKWGSKEKISDMKKLKASLNRTQRWAWEALEIACNVAEDDPYNKEHLIHYYENHNRNVKEYFRYRPADLLILNPSESDAMTKLSIFLELDSLGKTFPKVNVTKDLE